MNYAVSTMGQENNNDRDNNSVADSAETFREYAAECRRLAQRASEKDRKILMEIADAWIVCAEEAERKAKSARKK